MAESTVFTEEQKDELIQKIKDCDTAQREIDMAVRAGVPVGDAQEQLRQTRDQLMKLKNVYAPTRTII